MLTRYIPIFCLLFINLHAEFRSGFIIFAYPPITPENPGKIDFSNLNDSCGMEGLPDCPIAQVDFTFSQDSLRAMFGMVDLLSQDTTFPNIVYPPIAEAKAKIDLIVLGLKIVAPENDYVSALNFQGFTNGENAATTGRSYVVKTSENNYALMINYANYLGGLDRFYFYWALQTDGSRNLFPQAIGVVKKSFWRNIKQQYK